MALHGGFYKWMSEQKATLGLNARREDCLAEAMATAARPGQRLGAARSLKEQLKIAIMKCPKWTHGSIVKTSDVRTWLSGQFRKHNIENFKSLVMETMDDMEKNGFVETQRPAKREKGHEFKKYKKVSFATVQGDKNAMTEMGRLGLGRDSFE